MSLFMFLFRCLDITVSGISVTVNNIAVATISAVIMFTAFGIFGKSVDKNYTSVHQIHCNICTVMC